MNITDYWHRAREHPSLVKTASKHHRELEDCESPLGRAGGIIWQSRCTNQWGDRVRLAMATVVDFSFHSRTCARKTWVLPLLHLHVTLDVLLHRLAARSIFAMRGRRWARGGDSISRLSSRSLLLVHFRVLDLLLEQDDVARPDLPEVLQVLIPRRPEREPRAPLLVLRNDQKPSSALFGRTRMENIRMIVDT